MAFIATTAQSKVSRLRKRVRVVQGGTSASKTYTILPLLITYAIQNPNKLISVVSETFPHLRRGAIRDFENIMKDTNNWVRSSWSASNHTYEFSNGSKIEFFAADQEDKLRGARRDVLFINEANRVNFEAYDQLAIRTKEFIYVDFNPSHEFWAHTELKGQPEVDWITLTYKDNEATPEELIKEFERRVKKAEDSAYWKNWVNVYIYGRLGTLEGVIYQEHTTWQQVAAIPRQAELRGYGLDFGYTNDPTSCIAFFYMDGSYYLDEVMYNTRMTNKDIADKLKLNGLDRVQGWADSAEPKSIDYIKEQGCWIDGVEKGQDSIRNGIDKVLMQAPFYVTQRSLNLIKELRNYKYRESKMDKRPNKPNDPEPNQQDHAADAMRYFFMMETGESGYEHIVV